MKGKTRKELILEVFDSTGCEEISVELVKLINERLRAVYGRGGTATPGYIARVLVDAGRRVLYNSEPIELEPSLHPFEPLPFETLQEAEQSILLLASRYSQAVAVDDLESAAQCRHIAEMARLRARLIASNGRVDNEVRAVREEVAFWLELWLSTPELFADWLQLRKASSQFQEQFGYTYPSHFTDEEEL